MGERASKNPFQETVTDASTGQVMPCQKFRAWRMGYDEGYQACLLEQVKIKGGR